MPEKPLPYDIVQDTAQDSVELSERKLLSEEEIQKRLQNLEIQTRFTFQLSSREEEDLWRQEGIKVSFSAKNITTKIEAYVAEGVPRDVIKTKITLSILASTDSHKHICSL